MGVGKQGNSSAVNHAGVRVLSQPSPLHSISFDSLFPKKRADIQNCWLQGWVGRAAIFTPSQGRFYTNCSIRHGHRYCLSKMQQFIYVLHLISWLTPLENISSWMFYSAKKSSSMPKLEEVQVVLSCSIWVLCQMSKRGARTPWVPPSISTQGVMGDGGHHEPTSEISSTIWRHCSHPGWLNALC